MFSGIIEAMGTVTGAEDRDGGRRIAVRVPESLQGLPPGSSVAVDGTCLTVVAASRDILEFDAVGATIARTLFGSVAPGHAVNLERSLVVGARVDGHWVTGHVDGIGTVESLRPGEGAIFFTFAVPEALRSQIALRGSVAVDGVSLTVSGLTPGGFTVSIVPYTLDHTRFGGYAAGDRVHIETDVLAKYVERSLTAEVRA